MDNRISREIRMFRFLYFSVSFLDLIYYFYFHSIASQFSYYCKTWRMVFIQSWKFVIQTRNSRVYVTDWNIKIKTLLYKLHCKVEHNNFYNHSDQHLPCSLIIDSFQCIIMSPFLSCTWVYWFFYFLCLFIKPSKNPYVIQIDNTWWTFTKVSTNRTI